MCFYLFGNTPVGTREVVFFHFSPGIFKCQGLSWAKRAYNPGPVFRGFPPLGVRLAKTENGKKLRNFWEKLLGRADFPHKSAPSTKKLYFRLFRPGPEMLQVPKAKTGQKPTQSPFPTGGGPTKKKLVLRKLRKTIPDSVATFFFSPKVPLAPGNCVFLFLARARRPKTILCEQISLQLSCKLPSCFAVAHCFDSRVALHLGAVLRRPC